MAMKRPSSTAREAASGGPRRRATNPRACTCTDWARVHGLPRAHRGPARTRGPAHAVRRPARARHQRPPGGLRLHTGGPRGRAGRRSGRRGLTGVRGRGAQHGRRRRHRARPPAAGSGLAAGPHRGQPRPAPPCDRGQQRHRRVQEEDFVGAAATRACWRGSARVGGDHAPGGPACPAPQRHRLVRGHASHDARILRGSPIERVYLQGELSGELAGQSELEASGVRVVTVAGAGHNVMFDDADAFAMSPGASDHQWAEFGRLSPRGRPGPGSGRPRRRTTSCASPNRPAAGGGWAPRAGRPG